VLVDFNGRLLRGFAVSRGNILTNSQLSRSKKIIDKRKVFAEEMINFAEWISGYYFCGIGEVLSLMIPRAIKPAKDEEENNDFIPQIKVLSKEQNEIYLNIKEDLNNGNKNSTFTV